MATQTELSPGSVLQGGKYKIEAVLGQGGFGITYLGIQTGLKRKVAIKEFFMKEYCNRDSSTSHVSVGTEGSRDLVDRFRIKFIKEAQLIAGLDHRNIIKIHDIFEERGTAYYVMEYLDGGSLSSYVDSKGRLLENEAVGFIRQVGSALSYIHGMNINHLDVKPGNILLDKKGRAVLIDFGLSKRYDETGSQTSSTPVGISHGYAPLEQYKAGGVGTFSPTTDIYSLGATLYKLVTGQTPPDADVINDEGFPELNIQLSSSVRNAMEKAMQPRRKDRPQSVDAFLSLLDTPVEGVKDDESTTFNETDVEATVIDSSVKPKPVTPPTPLTQNPVPPTPKPSKKWLIPVLILIGILLGVGLWWVIEDQVDYVASGTINGYEYVDLGLSVKWATKNVGASSPSDYGDYYAWGETSTKAEYLDTNSLTYEKTMGDISGNPNYDVARKKWGSSWRLPTKSECEELVSKCTWKMVTEGFNTGYRVTGPNGKSIFLPAAGYLYGSSLYFAGEYGDYWSSTPRGSFTQLAYDLYFNSSDHDVNWGRRWLGHSVRPVSE